MSDLLRPALVICIILLVPILPFVFFGEQTKAWVEELNERPNSAPVMAAAIIGLLASDIFLPVPSSAISTLGGWRLGKWQGTAVSWVGLSLGAMLGFALARRWGRPLAAWISSERQLDRMQASSDKYGPLLLIVARGVPVFAEASVLLMGLNQLSWRRFLPPIVLSNLGIALAYSVFGDVARQDEWLPMALAISIGLPVILTTVVSRFLPHKSDVEL